MGEPNYRLNPQVESQIQRILLTKAIKILLSIVMLLPTKIYIRGTKLYDYRIIIALCILRIMLRKTYADYEIEMRSDLRICNLFGLQILPGKRIIGRSIWFCLRIKKEISKRDCDKTHLAVSSQFMFIMNWKITSSKKNDCPFFKKLLAPFNFLGRVLADKGYLSRENFQLVADKGGEAFIPFKKGSTDSPKSHPAWKFAFHFWKSLNGIYMSIYHQRSRIEAVFSALKKRYGDRLYCRKAGMRRKEMSLRL